MWSKLAWISCFPNISAITQPTRSTCAKITEVWGFLCVFRSALQPGFYHGFYPVFTDACTWRTSRPSDGQALPLLQLAERGSVQLTKNFVPGTWWMLKKHLTEVTNIAQILGLLWKPLCQWLAFYSLMVWAIQQCMNARVSKFWVFPYKECCFPSASLQLFLGALTGL